MDKPEETDPIPIADKMIRDLEQLNRDLAHLLESRYQEYIIDRSCMIIRRHLKMLRTDLIHSHRKHIPETERELFVDPVLSGTITKDESWLLENSGCIVRASDEDGNHTYAAINIATIIKQHQHTRAISRADVLSKIVDDSVLPIVIGTFMEPLPDTQQQATFIEYVPKFWSHNHKPSVS